MSVVIPIDVTDWAKEYQQEEVDLSTPEKLVEAQQDGLHHDYQVA